MAYIIYSARLKKLRETQDKLYEQKNDVIRNLAEEYDEYKEWLDESEYWSQCYGKVMSNFAKTAGEYNM